MQPVYLCVSAANFPAQALLRLREPLRNTPVAVLEGNPPQERVCSVNRAAQQHGVAIGMTRVEAETLAGALVLRRNIGEEEQAREAVLECAGRFSPSIEIEDGNAGEAATKHLSENFGANFLCVLEISGTEKLFGPPAELARKLRTGLTQLGIHASLAVSINFHAAVAMARATKGISIIPPGQENKSLSRLPLGVLDLSEAHLITLSLWGIKDLGALAALPEVELITRFGQQGKRMLQLAKGTRPHLFRPLELKFELKEIFAFDSPVEDLNSLLFVLSPMLDQLIVRARGHAQSLASITVAFTLDPGPVIYTESDFNDAGRVPNASPDYIRTIRPALATSDRKLLLKLLQLDMEGHPPAAAVLALTLSAETGEAGKVQLGLFSPQLPEASRLDVTLARLAAIVGEDRVGSPQLDDNHHPDSFHNTPFTIARGKSPSRGNTGKNGVRSSIAELQARGKNESRPALRRIRPPEPLQLQLVSQQPGSFAFRDRRYIVRAAYGPWKEGGAWWSTTRWSREEWDIMAETPEKDARLCCLITHDLLRRQWLMEALYD